MSPDVQAKFIDDLLEGELSEADFLRLEAELSVDPEAREAYYARLALSAALQSEAESLGLEQKKFTSILTDARPWWQTRTFAAVAGGLATAAAVVAMFQMMLVSPGRNDSSVAADKEQRASGFAVLTAEVGTEWGRGLTISKGSLVPAGELELLAGVAQMELFSGVMLVLEAPAKFEVLSSMDMTVANGRVRAHVPEPAQGFRIRMAEGDVVDLGTEFALSVSEGQAEVHVLDGEVDWYPRDTSVAHRLNEGEALRASSDTGELADMEADATAFVGASELGQRLASSRSTRHQQWRQFSQRLRVDDRVIAYYHTGTDANWDRRLPNLAEAGPAGEGAIVAAARATDRWGRSDGALDFSPTGSRVRVTVPGEYRSLTFLTWVKIHSLDRWYNSLFLTDGHEQFEPHWQIMDDGRLFFSVKKNDQWDVSKGEKDKHVYYSPSFWEASLSGQWLMLATTYDVGDRVVKHYLNGQTLSEEAIPEEYLVETVRIGNASLANWGLPEKTDAPNFAVRNLNGSMDEFVLFNTALSPSEILQFYDHGKP